ncbi:MAG: hypothetical protein GEV07_25885 [Streptosporangiales bacterium]|nr:hypothetical protein [Streptosporangiales bacterium]
MGRRGVAAQRNAAAVSACARARRTIGRLLIAGAFCLAGWAVLAVFDASPVAASERPAAEHRLDPTTIADAARATADRATSATQHRDAGDHRETAATEESRPSEAVADRIADTGDRDRPRLKDAPVIETLRDAGDELAPSGVECPKPDSSVCPKPDSSVWPKPDDSVWPDEWPTEPVWPHELLPGASEQPGEEPGDGLQPEAGQSAVVPGAVAEVPGAAAGDSMSAYVSRSLPTAATPHREQSVQTNDAERRSPQLPSWPGQLGLPYAANTGPSSSVQTGAGNAPVATLGAVPGTAAAGTPLVLSSAPRGPTLSNDAVKPPVSPD